MQKSALVLLTSFICLQVTADESSFTKGLPPSQRAFISGAINLSTDKFIAAYNGDNVPDRRYAEIYLLGVLEATEGVSWCSYQRFKTGTIDAVIYEELKKITQAEKQQRAASIITSILKRKFPCQGSNK